MRNLLKILVVVSSLVAATSSTSAEMVSLQEGVSPTAGYVADATFVRDMLPGDAHNSTRPNELIIGTSSGDNLRTLLEFDLSEISNQAGGRVVTIDGVQLVLDAYSVYNSNTITVDVFQYDYDLDETTSTWNNPDGLGNDPNAGGTLGTFLSGESFSATGDVSFADTAAFRTAVSGALGSPDNTLRLILKDHNEGESGVRLAYCRSNEYVTASGDRPELIVNFTVIPEPTSAALLCCGALAMICMGRRRTKRNMPKNLL